MTLHTTERSNFGSFTDPLPVRDMVAQHRICTRALALCTPSDVVSEP